MELENKTYPYPLRPDVVSDKTLGGFRKKPEFILNEQEREVVLVFERGLTRGEEENLVIVSPTQEFDKIGQEETIKKIETGTLVGLEQLWGLKVNSTQFYLDYFLTSKGQQDLARVFGIDPKSVVFKNFDKVKKFFYGYPYADKDKEKFPSLLIEISGNSRRFAEGKMVDQFAASSYANVDQIENPTAITIIRNPEVLAAKIAGLRRLKNYHRNAAEDLNGKSDPVSLAKKVMLTIHQRRVNELLAELYPEALLLIKQNQNSPTGQTQNAIAIIEKNLSGLGIFETDNKAMRAFSRLDRFVQGTGRMDEESKDFTALSKQAIALVEELQKQATNPISDYEFEDVDPKKFLEVKVKAEEWQEWAKKTLNQYELLSSQPDSEYNPDRVGRAPDNLWQVVLDPSRSSLDIDSRQGVIKVPSKMDRSIASVSPEEGAVPVLDHEIFHLLQQVNKERLGLAITNKVGMDRSLIYAEAGAIIWESQAQESMFGQANPADPHYLRAVQARLKSGTLKDCLKAFFDSSMAQNPNADKKKTAKIAVDRASRLFRKGEEFTDTSPYLTNSKPLVYLEQELLVRQLREAGLEKLLAIGGTNLEMLAKLNRIGMLNLENIFVPDKKPSEIIKDEIKQRLGITT